MNPISISIVPTSNLAVISAKIERELLCALAQTNAQTENASLVFTARNDDDELIGGAAGSTSYGWLLVKMLWVSEALRGSGIGQQLIQAIEDEGRNLGCHSAWLDTSNADARSFYIKLGYADFGVLENGPGKEPEHHARWFMKKEL